MIQLYLSGLFLLICGTIVCGKIKKWSRLTDILFVITLSYFFVGVALSGIKIYLAGLLLLGSGTLICMKNINCRGAEPLFYFTQYYIFIGLVVNGIMAIKEIEKRAESSILF